MNRTSVNSRKHDAMIAKPQTSALLCTAHPQRALSFIEHFIIIILQMR